MMSYFVSHRSVLFCCTPFTFILISQCVGLAAFSIFNDEIRICWGLYAYIHTYIHRYMGTNSFAFIYACTYARVRRDYIFYMDMKLHSYLIYMSACIIMYSAFMCICFFFFYHFFLFFVKFWNIEYYFAYDVRAYETYLLKYVYSFLVLFVRNDC